MSNIFNRILENLATRLMFIIYILFIVVTGFFITLGYFQELDLQKERQYDRLSGIVSSLSTSIDGDSHKYLMENFNSATLDRKLKADSIYKKLNEQLHKAKEASGLNSPIYTLVKSSDSQVYYGVRCDEFVDINNKYKRVPELLVANYEIGGVLPAYESENGVWISAFHPIKSSNGKVVALLEADIEFSQFREIVNGHFFKRLLISLLVIIVIFLIFIKYTKKVLREEVQKKRELSEQKRIIEFKNKDIMDSMHYALKIQNKILPSDDDFKHNFRDSFIYYESKDIVAGDFYWMREIDGKIYIAVADCTGHGVPGAILSIICANILDNVVGQMKISDPADILNEVRSQVISYLTKGDFAMNDGMDIALCQVNFKSSELKYSGAYNPIYIVREGELMATKACKQPIGKFDYSKNFTSTTYKIIENDIIYLFTDGYADQFGGPNNKKFKYRNFRELLLSTSNMSHLKNQKDKLSRTFTDWKGDNEQIDDVCVIGIKF
ncbi:MAG: PP2C family protein-serine/threonine phosphatase [Crocinitomicaceae bacterium]